MRGLRIAAAWIDRAVLLALVGLAAGVSSCSEKPTEPVFDNILDPAVGNVLNTRVAFEDGHVIVTWDHLVAADLGEEVKSYQVWRSISPESGFASVSTVDEVIDDVEQPDVPGQRVVTDAGYYPYRANYYGVTFTTSSDRTVSIQGVPRVEITTPPRVRLQTGASTTPTRNVTLKVQAANTDEAQVSSDETFGSFTVVQPVPTPDPFNEAEVAWDLGPAVNGDTLRVFVRVPLAEGGFSAPGSLGVVTDFDPELKVVEAPVVQPDIHLEVPVAGVERMRFATSGAELNLAAWIVPQPAALDTLQFQLSTADATPEIWAQYEGDFGFDVVHTTPVVTTAVGPATLTIDGGAEFTTNGNREVMVVSAAPNATLMRIAETPDFAGVSWVAFDDTVTVQLSEPPGTKTLYGWYTNAFDLEGQVATDEIILVGESPRPR